MRESGGRLVLMDFGTGEELSGTNRLVGTPLYLAPEIFRGQRASVQSDLYSLGVLLFYLVTGKFPVMAGSMEQLARAHATASGSRCGTCGPTCPRRSSRRWSAPSTAIRAPVPERGRYRVRAEGVGRRARAGRVVAPVPEATPSSLGLGFVPVVAALVLAVAAFIVWTAHRVESWGRGVVDPDDCRDADVDGVEQPSRRTLPAG